jgi:hypothetical protein
LRNVREVRLEDGERLVIEVNRRQASETSPFHSQAKAAAATKQVYASSPVH